MAKKTPLNQNASLPPILVLSTFLLEQKREFVHKKLKEFGLVRKEYFDKKLGHKKRDFQLKKLFGKRYRLATAPLNDAEVVELYETIQTLITLKGEKTTDFKNLNDLESPAHSLKSTSGFSLINLFLLITSLGGLGGAGYYGFTIYETNLEFAVTLGALAVIYFFLSLGLIRINQLIKRAL
jgi:hypothetical protein